MLCVATSVDHFARERAGDVCSVSICHVFSVVGVGEIELDLAMERVGLVVLVADGMVGVVEVAVVDVDSRVGESDDLVLSVDVMGVERLDVGASAHHFLHAVFAEKAVVERGVGLLIWRRGVIDHAVDGDDTSLRGEEGDDEGDVVCLWRYTSV